MVNAKWLLSLATAAGAVSADYNPVLTPPPANTSVPLLYDVVYGFFKQTWPGTINWWVSHPKNFGLYDNVTWGDVVDEVSRLNKQNNGKKYKLIFAARHGQGYHNLVPFMYPIYDYICKWQMRDGNGKIEWFDAALTPEGEKEIDQINAEWKVQIADGAPVPQTFYLSPLRRTLQTFDLTWNDITNFNEKDQFRPLVREYAREVYGIDSESRRHDKEFILQNWPWVKLPEGFSDTDPLWSPTYREPNQHTVYRAQLLLDDIFANDDNEIISLTSHSELLYGLMDVVQQKHWHLGTGEMIPLLVEASDFGAYKQPPLTDPWDTLPKWCKLIPSFLKI